MISINIIKTNLLVGTLKNFLMLENLEKIKIKITTGTAGDKLTSFSQNSYLLPISQNNTLSAGIGRKDSNGISILQENNCAKVETKIT